MTTIRTASCVHDTKITLHTRICREIPNDQCHEFSAYEKATFHEYERDYRSATFRTPPNPIYNCHGLAFASKRTRITDSQALSAILGDDGYTEVKKEKVLPGDIIMYYSGDGDYEHSGIVVSEPDQNLKIPRVVSKWGSYKEAVHWANCCPYNYANVRYYRVTKWD